MAYKKRKFKGVNKYHAKKAVVDGVVFDSMKEAERYTLLKKKAEIGQISSLQRQVKFTLIPAQYEESNEVFVKGPRKGQKKPGKLLERECAYIADFVYTENGQQVVEDTKGCKAGAAYAIYKIKRKLMLYIHGIKIKEI